MRFDALRSSLLIILFCSSIPVMQAQWWKVIEPEDVWLFQVGVSADLGVSTHSGSFTLPQAPTCCKEYTASLSFGPSMSLFMRHELTKFVRLTFRGTYATNNATFETDENIFVTNSVPGLTRHTLDVNMGWVGGEGLIDLRIANPIRLMFGASFGVLMQPNFTQRETLIIPGTGTFENGRRVRNETVNTDLQDITTPNLGAVVGLGFDIPMTQNHSVILTPEVLYTIGLSDIVKNVNWRSNLLRVGVSVAFSLNAPEPPMPVERRREEFIDSLLVDALPDAEYRRVLGAERVLTDTVVGTDIVTITDRAYRTDTVYSPIRPELKANIVARAIEASGAIKDVFTVNVSTQFVTEALPLLPVVFFEAHSISLSFRYRQLGTRSEFDYDAMPPKTTSVHHEILNIVGSRLSSMPGSSVRLRGTADPTTEGADCELARKRAVAVKDYLVRVWAIEPDRITVETASGSCAPERATRQPSEEGFSENRRVEILTSDLGLIASVAKRRFNEARTIDPPKILFDPHGSSSRYVTDWELEARSGDAVVFSQRGKGAPTQITQELTTSAADLMIESRPLTATLKVNGLHNSSANASTTLKVKKDTLRVELERLTLTLFDVASDAVTAVAEEQIKSFVENVPAGSTVAVRGYADLLGNAEFNRKLSQKRAEAVCLTIRKHLKKRVDLQCNEIATDRYPPGIESYKTPEERFLSRTVQIEVKRSR